ncbi:PREDICTED: protein S100-A14 [Ficedula albicollis]|uniref:S100 calcium binding protein A14 n=2 Tax=Passeriformes TaxID=9126 RepID=U3KBZ8_FICAL|nr:PREDICTED: protein S100-A14 [Ficedula albicollis]
MGNHREGVPARRRFPAPRWRRARLPNETPRTAELPLTHTSRYKTPARISPRTPGPARAAAPPDPTAEERPPETPRDPRGAASSRMGQCNCRKKRKDGQELTDVERAIETVISQFHCYAVKGQKEYLTPNEMQELVVQKLPHLGKCVGPLEEKIECMGDPNEAKLEFGEYWDMMGDAAKGCRRK